MTPFTEALPEIIKAIAATGEHLDTVTQSASTITARRRYDVTACGWRVLIIAKVTIDLHDEATHPDLPDEADRLQPVLPDEAPRLQPVFTFENFTAISAGVIHIPRTIPDAHLCALMTALDDTLGAPARRLLTTQNRPQ